MTDDMNRPIGYWLKHLDHLIDGAMDAAFAEEGVTRRHWQILNTLHAEPRDEVGLTAALGPFSTTLGEVMSELVRRGWVAGRYALTPAGETAHTTIQEKVQAVRARFLTNLTTDDYQRTVTTLRHMAENLESAPPAHCTTGVW